MLFDVMLVANAGDEPYFLVGEGLPTLFEHVGVADVEAVEDSVGVDPQHLLFTFASHRYYQLH